MSDFTDGPHLRHVRRLLWADREFGRAAVMVGAGFSRNAEPISASVRPIPLWNDLVLAMNAKVQGVSLTEVLATHYGASPPRAASDFEHMFGRPALDEFLRNELADSNFAPGALHRSLLSLPWSDIFTTNYDTLLERARSGVVGRRYDVVTTPGDIAMSMKPRIVKLHGSFPSRTPFIITEEDFRKYPHDFAGFVNTVQQSIMENAFCLLGFSGEDPNFLQWSGWVRDNLGAAAPTLYLVGVLDLLPWKRQVLSRRFVTPIDLGPLFPPHDFPNRATRHRAAIQWFLDSLALGAPLDPREWPRDRHSTPSPRGGPASLPPDDSPPRVCQPLLAHPATAEQFEALRLYWAEQRRRYPGWLIPPPDVRARLWRETSSALLPVLGGVDTLPSPQRLSFLFELVWRLERIEAPGMEPIPQSIDRALRALNPFPRHLDIAGSLCPGDVGAGSQDWDALSTFWIELAFFALKTARRSASVPAYEEYHKWLLALAGPYPELSPRLSWESCLSHLAAFSVRGLKSELDRWLPTKDPLWQLRRGSLLAEAGDLRQGSAALLSTLEDVRQRLHGAPDDRYLLSLEGWTMAAARSALLAERGDVQMAETYASRFAQLERYGASPLDDLESLKVALRHVPPEPAAIERRKTFDPGSYTSTRRFSSDFRELVGFQTLAILERGGVPLRLETDRTFASLAESAALLIKDSEPNWATAMLVRSGARDGLQAAFSRPRVVALAVDAAAKLIRNGLQGLSECLMPVLDESATRAEQSSMFWRFFVTLSELMSRMTIRMQAGELAAAFKIVERVVVAPAAQGDWRLWEPLQALLRRTLDALSDVDLAAALPGLLRFPLPGEGAVPLGPGRPERWPEPFDDLEMRLELKVPVPEERISELLAMVRTRPAAARKRAAFRLAWLDEAGLLSGHRAAFGEALWSRIDPVQHLPADTDYFPHAFLFLPAPALYDPKTAIRAYLLNTEFPPLSENNTLSDGRTVRSVGIPNPAHKHFRALLGVVPLPWRDNSRGITWCAEEAKSLLERASTWWSREESYVASTRERRHSRQDGIFSVLHSFLSTLGVAIFPFLNDSGRREALELLDRVASSGVPTVSARAVLVARGSSADSGAQLAGSIRAALASKEPEVVEYALDAIGHWHFYASEGSSAPADLLDAIVTRVLARRQPAAHHAMTWTILLADKLPNALRPEHRRALEAALELLLVDTDVSLPTDESEGLPFVLEERPEYRALAAMLAAVLRSRIGSTEGTSACLALERWREIGERDPLPEVRRAWLWRRGSSPS